MLADSENPSKDTKKLYEEVQHLTQHCMRSSIKQISVIENRIVSYTRVLNAEYIA